MPSPKTTSMANFLEECAALTRETMTSRDMTLAATETTPQVIYKSFSCELTINGNCTTELADEFFQPIINRVRDDLQVEGSSSITFFFKSLGPQTARILFELFAYLKIQASAGKQVKLTWISSKFNPQMRDVGKALSELYHLNMHLDGVHL